MNEDKQVVVEKEALENDDIPLLTFHKVGGLAVEWDWDVKQIPVKEAREKGAVACSKCFESEDGILYDFQYLEGNEVVA